ncbi:Pkinase-domain-containing protein [Trichoderma citrinoviride]|uniref:non-specific serine/threonine protein kinase n=1 Tax=Trichoderma citrinoviride TaxID=58853 RepID=A0A2T4BDM5_9HYPO|nr:Pkinase-domain-containing protein [Trichoderma citrinoviride]PTB67440.1 Pkinase-domain-containing protein [Trichoderma citrinoviride]
MLQTHGGPQDNRTDSSTRDDDRGHDRPMPALSLPKNRSTGNLHLSADPADRSRYRMSFEASSAGIADHDPITRPSPIADHEHGLGLSGLRRIRQQHPPSRAPTLPSSNASSRSPSVVALTRSTSMTAMLSTYSTPPFAGAPNSPSFSEDLSRFPSESLHSFSFAHQSEDFLHNRQNVLKRSLEFMKDRMGLSMTSTQAGLASAQARVTGDVDAQHMLELLARAQVIGAGNLPNPDPSSIVVPPLTGPAGLPAENVFEKEFSPRASISESTTAPDDTHTFLQEELARRNETASRPTNLKRTMTDTMGMALQDKLLDTMSQPFLPGEPLYEEPLGSPVSTTQPAAAQHKSFSAAMGPAVHGHTNRWVPAAQAIFTTEAKPPWTILAANDLACLVFGVTKAEVRKMGILEVVQEERRAWLERRLLQLSDADLEEDGDGNHKATPAASAASALLGGRGGITAQLLSKPNSRTPPSQAASPRRAQTVHSGDPNPPATRTSGHHRNNLSRGVLLCGDVVPIQKRNGATGSASLWVKEKRVGLIWVLEEIHEDVAHIVLDEEGIVQSVTGATEPIWGFKSIKPGFDVAKLIPRIPRQGIDPNEGEIDFAQTSRRRYFTCPNSHKSNIPCAIEQVRGKLELRVSTFPHMAGIVVVEPETLKIRSSNSVFSGALFGYEKPDGMPIYNLIPDFDKILATLTEEDGLQLLDGMVVPEHRFRRAAAFFALKEQRPNAAAAFLQPEGIPARHRDGSELKIDVQMRVVESEKHVDMAEESDSDTAEGGDRRASVSQSELVFALWITYSRHLHTSGLHLNMESPDDPVAITPPHQPSPGQTPAHTPMEIPSDSDEPKIEDVKQPIVAMASAIPQQIKDVALDALDAAAKLTGTAKTEPPKETPKSDKAEDDASDRKTTIDDYTILEDMGQGAYGQVKLARHKKTGKKVVLKYVTKRRILVDTWTRDRKLGTVPLEIHVLNYLRKPEFRHPNIVEMEGFFEDDVNYYIEMAPHGLPGMDLFDYIELRANMDEDECRSIFVQVAQAVHFLHTRAQVVHRDIKDENVILDGAGNIKLIDFGSAAYIRSGPFDVFVGTIDYAAPEVLAGKPYGGREQDVWALGILLYTIVYKENPFYSIDEIMDRDLRIPFVISEDSIDLIRCMLNRDVAKRFTIEQVLDHPWCREHIGKQK